ncbi:envelope-like protein, partial [Trifolium medium]|nr:envelope-like protein [Trifolium medium]
AILNKIAATNWVPTTHSSNVAKALGKFIYVVGTKASIILEQHPDILVGADSPCRRIGRLTVDKKLLSGTHVEADVERKSQIDRVIEALKAEEEVDHAEGEEDGQEEEEASGFDGDTEKIVEDSDESSSN